MIRAYPFEPLYFLPLAREVRRAVRMPLVLLGGIKSIDDLETAMREGFELAAMARALIHDPALIAKYQAGSARTSGCIPCNQCVAEMDREGGVRCARVPEQLAQRERVLEVASAVTAGLAGRVQLVHARPRREAALPAARARGTSYAPS